MKLSPRAEQAQERARHGLEYYFRLMADASGVQWTSDNVHEIWNIVDDIIDAAITHIADEDKRTKEGNEEFEKLSWKEQQIAKYGPDRFEDMMDEAREVQHDLAVEREESDESGEGDCD